MAPRTPSPSAIESRPTSLIPAVLRVLISAALVLLGGPAPAAAFETKAAQAFMIDAETGTVLFSKDADRPIPPASLAKLMTMEVVFNALKDGRLAPDTTFKVSENAWRKGGAPSRTSTMFAALNSQIKVSDLLQGVIVQQANDGCMVLAEGMAGSEQGFAALMNARARQLGLSRSTFSNATGLPAPGQAVTVRDLAALGLSIWRNYPQFYGLYAQPDFTWNKITQRNRNPLLTMGIGADGMGIGFTEGSGYAIVGSLAQDGRRLFAAMGGLASEKERAEEARRLLEFGLNGFRRTVLFGKDEVVGEAQVYGGSASHVPLKAAGPVELLVPAGNKERLVARIIYQGPLTAPVTPGARVGTLKVWIGEAPTLEVPLFSAEAVAVGSLHRRAIDAVGELLVGWMR